MLAVEEVGTELRTREYLSQWLRHCRGRLRSKTHEGYEGAIRLYALPALGGIALARLHPLDLQECYATLLDRGLSGGTVRNLHLVLAQALSQAVRWGLIERSPASGAQPLRARRPEPVVVDPALAARILHAVAGTPMELPAVLALGTGMRRGEILALRWADLDPGFTALQVRRSLQVSGEGPALRGAQDPAVPAPGGAARLPRSAPEHPAPGPGGPPGRPSGLGRARPGPGPGGRLPPPPRHPVLG